MRRWIAAVAIAASGCAAGTLPAIHSDAERLRVASQLHQRGKCVEAIELLKSFIASSAGTAQVDEAIYLLGDCYLKTKEWTLGQAEFERLLRDYPESDSSGAAAFKLGEALFGQTRPRDFDQEFTARAIEQWNRYLQAYPGHWLNAEAQRRVHSSRSRMAAKLVDTGDLYFKLKLLQPAELYYRRVVEEYADTSAVAEAKLGLAMVGARRGRREEAMETLRRLKDEFPGQEVGERAARELRRLTRG